MLVKAHFHAIGNLVANADGNKSFYNLLYHGYSVSLFSLMGHCMFYAGVAEITRMDAQVVLNMLCYILW